MTSRRARPRAVGLSRVGVTGVEKVVRIRDELFFARLECFVDLSREQKGAHMSRFEEVVNEAIGEVVLSESPFRAETLAQHIAELVRARQGAAARRGDDRRALPRAQARARLGRPTQEIYTLHGRAVAFEHGTRRIVGVSATGMTACPCAQELVAARARERLREDGFSEEQIERILEHVPVATHNQRGLATLQIGCIEDCDAEIDAATLLAIAEASMSSEIYELMKRSDEVEVVEKAHRRPRFVEDCVREMIAGVVARFPELDGASFVSARQENLETIHQHNVVAERHGLLAELRAEIDVGHARRAPDDARRVARRRAAVALATSSGRAGARPSARSARVASRSRRALRLRDPPAQAEEVVQAREHGHERPSRRAARAPTAAVPCTAITARIAAICRHVLTLPNMLAAITTPACVAPRRSTVTASSRVMITIATHAASRCSETSEISAATISSLSASGSISLPKVVIESARAREVAVDEVRQRGEREHDRGEHVALRGVAEQRDDEHRHEHDAQHRQHVG